MIYIKTGEDISLMKRAGEVLIGLFSEIEKMIDPGITTYELDEFARNYIVRHGAKPAFLGYNGYTATLCVSIDEEVVHGIPSRKRKLKNGMIVGIDAGAELNGFYSDATRTFAVGEIGKLKKRLLDVTRESLERGIENAYSGNRLGTLSHNIQKYVEKGGFSVVREYVGHGIGRKLHEEPVVSNYGTANTGIKLLKGMALAIEPMVNAGDYKTKVLDNGWTVVTVDGLPSAHFEDTVVITDGKPIITTRGEYVKKRYY